ncbi:MAG: DNA polymerase III subunit delta' [Actinomycetota bacterium]
MSPPRDKDRPIRMWDRLIGQDDVVAALRESIDAGSVGHALLFAGPEGVGRRLAALALAASLNCEDHGCGECSVCAKVLRGAHPDVHLIVPEGQFILLSQIKGDAQTKGVIGEAYRSPFEGSNIVFIIEDAERLNASAANALLKVLEEPPADVLFILMTAHPEDLPETILSRCRRLDFSPLGSQEIRRVLEQHHRIDAQRAAWAAEVGGNLVRALRLAHDQDAPARYERHRFIPTRLQREGITGAIKIASELSTEAEQTTAHVRDRQAQEVSQVAEMEGAPTRGKSARGSAAIRKRLETRHRRELRRAELDAIQAALDDISSHYREILASAATGNRTHHPARLIADIERIEWTKRALDRNVAPTLALESLFAVLSTS